MNQWYWEIHEVKFLGVKYYIIMSKNNIFTKFYSENDDMANNLSEAKLFSSYDEAKKVLNSIYEY